MTFQEAKQLIPMDDLLDRLGVHRRGRRYFCPFHDDGDSPASAIHNNYLHCFVCNKNFDVFDVAKHHGIDHATLCGMFGFDMGKPNQAQLDAVERKRQEKRDRQRRIDDQTKQICQMRQRIWQITRDEGGAVAFLDGLLDQVPMHGLGDILDSFEEKFFG